MSAHISLLRKETAVTEIHPELKLAPSIDQADLLVAYLEQMGIEFVFGVPGGAIEPLYNALARSSQRGGVKHVLARHEAGAAFMADGYARETGKIGVCCSTSGPGATNLITGVACAYDNNIPMLVITGQPALPAFGKYPLQESSCTGINTLGMFRHCTRYNSLVSHPKQLETKLVTALQRAVRTPRGPVHLTVPVDVFRSPTTIQRPSYDLHELLAPASMIDADAVDRLSEKLSTSKKIVLLIGGGCGEAIGSILQFASLKGTALVTTPDAKGLVNPRHPLFRGVFGFGGHESADAALRDNSVDLILAVGANMGEWNSGGWSESVLNERLIHIDESEENLARTPMARLHVRGRILSVFSRLVENLHNRHKPDDFDYARNRASRDRNAIQNGDPLRLLAEQDKYESDAIPLKPQRLMRELGLHLPPSTRFLADTGNSVSWSVHYLHPAIDRRVGERRMGGGGRKTTPGQRKNDGGWLRVTMNFAAMGWAIGGAVGTAIADRKRPVVCITGDGSMLMNGQEISVAVAEELSIIFVVLNDQSLGMVKHGQRLANAEQIGCELPPSDFAAIARALGAEAYTIKTPDDLIALDYQAICSRKGPTLLDVLVDPEEEPPMNVRMRVLTSGK